MKNPIKNLIYVFFLTFIYSSICLLINFYISTPAYSKTKKTITIACGAVGIEFSLCKKHAKQWAQETNNEVNFYQMPKTTNERLALFQQYFAAKSSEIDVIQIDVVWPGTLKNHLLDLNKFLSSKKLSNEKKDHYKKIFENNITPNNQLLALPFFTDVGLLYYRKDLLKKHGFDIPKRWSDLKKISEIIIANEKEKNPKLMGYVWQGKPYEGLTCNALEWIYSFGGGKIIDKNGNITINNKNAILALETAKSWLNTITPISVLNYDEESTRGVFQLGNAIFMRNWPYAWSLLTNKNSSVKDKVGVTFLPRGDVNGKHTGTLGGWALAVSKYSKHPKTAVSLVEYLTSKKIQIERALEASYNPTRRSAYNSLKNKKSNILLEVISSILKNAVARPSIISGKDYNKVSAKFYNAIFQIISGNAEVKSSVEKLERDLKFIKKRGKW